METGREWTVLQVHQGRAEILPTGFHFIMKSKRL